MRYKKIILGRIHCEKAPQVVRACPSEGHHSCGHHGHQTEGQHGWDREEPEDIFLIFGADIEMGHFLMYCHITTATSNELIWNEIREAVKNYLAVFFR